MKHQIEETHAEANALDYLEDIQSYVRDMTHTIRLCGETYLSSDKFQADLRSLQQAVAQGV